MSNAGIALQEGTGRARHDPQRVAWGVLLLAFAMFCLTCVATGVGVYYFLFQSTSPLDMELRVGRGSIGVNQQFVPLERDLLNGDELSTGTDGQSQATVLFFDPQQQRRLIATVTVKGGTNLILRRALRPRFDWGNGQYSIEVQDFAGDLEVFVVRDLAGSFRMTINTQQGNLIDLGASGRYSVSVREGQTRVVNQEGKAALIPADRSQGRDIPEGSQGTIYTESPNEVSVVPAYVNLLENSTFEDTALIESAGGEMQVVARIWGCRNDQVSAPRGTYRTEIVDGRTIMRFVRGENATSNGETRCVAFLGQSGRDVSGYDYLEMRASFSLNYQSLAACGWQGSECPLMLQVDYVDEDGELQTWYHGFYYLQPQPGNPLTCSSCRQEHDRVNEKSWYTYTSGNLLALLGPDERPQTILNVQFYASGHQYDVSIGEISLLVGQMESAQAAAEATG
ncbi:MAG: hypothetical protein HXY41_08255 [Chloroflexi bacterium]|nr:hypothetical protein [Chloroflexota bacterium]